MSMESILGLVGLTSYFYPDRYNVEDCGKAVIDINAKFPVGYEIDVSHRKVVSEPPGQQISATNGTHHWASGGKTLYFHHDVDVSEVIRVFPVGYRMQVSYATVTDLYDIVTTPAAASCWGPGTELVLTSHTRWSKDEQVATVSSSNPLTGVITLSTPIKKPISKVDHADFAIEVASLNRPVVFEAESDTDNDVIGGHIIIHHTSSYQHIEGVEIRNFGQQGRLGRYPLHFHMCNHSMHSEVKRNVV
jgi:hypothetical protein